MHGDAECEEVLRLHAETMANQWSLISTQPSDGTRDDWRTLWAEWDEHRLDCYVSPVVYIEAERSPSVEPMGFARQSQTVPGENDDQLLHVWKRSLESKRHIVVYDRAGSGKSVMSLRLVHLLTSAPTRDRCIHDGHYPLVVRWSGEWPHACLGSIADALAADPLLVMQVPDVDSRHRCVRYALDNRLVTIILDGFDQLSANVREHVRQLLKPTGNVLDRDAYERCRWVITTREQVFEEMEDSLFVDSDWARVRQEPFNAELQEAYFQKPEDRPISNWRDLLPKRKETNEWTGLPLVLRAIRRLVELPESDGDRPRWTKFETPAELFAWASRLVLSRAILKPEPGLAPRAKQLGLSPESQLELTTWIIGLLAFQLMMTADSERDRDKPNANGFRRIVRKLKDDAAIRFLRSRIESLLKPKPSAVETEFVKQRVEHDLERWEWGLAFLESFELKNRVRDEECHSDTLFFRSRAVLEGHAAVYLARFATDHDLMGNGKLDDQAELTMWTFMGSEKWRDCLKLAIDMPRWAIDPTVHESTMSVFFKPMRQPARRPTELIVRAWHRLTKDISPGLERMLDDYRQQFIDILNGENLESARLAAELIPFPKVQYLESAQRLAPGRANALKPEHAAFVRIPPNPNENEWTGWVGEHDKVKLAHARAFWIATCCVTWAQYRLFCPELENSNPSGSLTPPRIPEEDCPVSYASWWDAVAFSLWLGDDMSPPDRVNWEIAARGGRNREEHSHDFVGVPPFDVTVTTGNVNFDGNQTLSGQKSFCIETELPVRWDQLRKERAQRENSIADRLPAYLPNGYGLWHANGNVNEWCLNDDDWTNDSQEVSICDLHKTTLSDRRIIAGGHWGAGAAGVRTAGVYHAVVDTPFAGIRLSCCVDWEPARTEHP